jgi:hypothetical protein
MKSWKAWLLVAAIFLTGAVAGAFGMRTYMARHLPELLHNSRQRLEEVFLEHIDREVGLSEQQKQKILPILRDAVEQGEAIRESVRTKMDAVMEKTDARIADELDPQQRAKFEEFRARMEQLRRSGPKPGDPMPPGPPPGPGGFPPGPPPGPHPGAGGFPSGPPPAHQ